MRQYVLHNHAEVVPKNIKGPHPVNRVPHRGVRKEDSLTTKLRAAADTSFHTQGVPLLSDCLEKGDWFEFKLNSLKMNRKQHLLNSHPGFLS